MSTISTSIPDAVCVSKCMRRLMVLQECWVHWIVYMYDGRIVLLLFRQHTRGKKSTQQLCWMLSLTVIYGFGVVLFGFVGNCKISISLMPIHYRSVLLTELICTLMLISVLTMMMHSQSLFLVNGIYPPLSHFVKTISVPILLHYRVVGAY